MLKEFKLSMIVANDLDGGIGYKNSLPWERHDGDMKWLKEKVQGKYLLMGKNTLLSLPAKNIHNTKYLVVTSNVGSKLVKEFSIKSKQDLINQLNDYSRAKKIEEIVLFGGKKLYDFLIDEVDELYITTFQDRFRCDTYIDREYYVGHFSKLVYSDMESYKDAVFEVYQK